MNNEPIPNAEQICDLCRQKKPTRPAWHRATRSMLQVCDGPDCLYEVDLPQPPASLQRRPLIGRAF